MQINNKQINVWLAVIAGIIVLYFFYIWFRSLVVPILMPFVLATIIVYILNPLVAFLENKKVPRIIAILTIYASTSAALFFISIYFIPRLIVELDKLAILFPRYVEELERVYLDIYQWLSQISLPDIVYDNIQKTFDELNIIESLGNRGQALAQGMVERFTELFVSFFTWIFNLFIAFIVSFYALKDLDKFKAGISNLVPKKYHKQFFHFTRDVDEALSAFIRGQLTVCFIVGSISFMGLVILGVDFALLLGVFAGITNIVPYFGPVIGTIPAVVIAILQSPFLALRVLLLFVVIQQVESTVITPKIVGGKVGLHPILIIFILLVGGRWKGILGMLIAIPIAAIIKVTLRHIGLVLNK